MTTVNQTIRSLLASNDVSDPQRLDVAILFAESMIQELQALHAEWTAAAATLQNMKKRHLLRRISGDRPDAFKQVLCFTPRGTSKNIKLIHTASLSQFEN